jgi:hypothetical protein
VRYCIGGKRTGRPVVRGSHEHELRRDLRRGGEAARAADGLDKARPLEDSLGLLVSVNQCGLGQFFYRFAEPGEL